MLVSYHFSVVVFEVFEKEENSKENKMKEKLEEIAIFLAKLELKTDRIPTYAEYKKKYREKLHLHPDKAGSESEDVFKEITEAAKKVHDWIIENPDLQKTNTDEYKRVAKCFSRENRVEYNKNNVVIHLDEEQCIAWMEALTKRFGASVPLEDQVGVQFKTLHLKKARSSETFGSFSASVWQNPKKGAPKIMLQGKAYMTFVIFVLPDILKEIESRNETLAIETDANEEEQIEISDDANGVTRTNTNLDTLMIGFQKMESEVIKLRDNLVGIVDQSLHQIKDNVKTEKLEKKLEFIEKIAIENKSELKNLNNKIDEVIAHQQRIKPVDVDALEEFIFSSKTTFTKLEDITTIHADAGVVAVALEKIEKISNEAITEVLNDSRNIVAKLGEVSRATLDIKEDIKSDFDDMKAVIESGNKILPELHKISKNVSSLMEHLETPKVQAEPSVRPKEKKNKLS